MGCEGETGNGGNAIKSASSSGLPLLASGAHLLKTL